VNPKNFFAELRRRSVYKVAIAYGIVAWLLIQAGSILFPTFEAPGWVMKALVTVIAAGFPIALVLAWAFELTPEGIKRTEDLDVRKSIARRTGRKLTGIIIAVAFVALGLFLFQLVGIGYRGTQSDAEHRERQSVTAVPANERSIAVLPIVNMSSDQENAYFVDGLTEEILNRLAQIKALKVPGHTSSFAFKNQNRDLRQIGAALGVAHALEGSVRKSGERLRITAQLVRTSDGYHLWSQVYDRKLDDVFAI
jgi:TolB-like protein